MASQGKDIVTKRLESITKRLGLSVEQQAEIKPILEDEQAKLQELRGSTLLTSDEKKEKNQELRDATYNRIRPILSPEQQKTHDAALDKSAASRKNRENKDSTVKPIK